MRRFISAVAVSVLLLGCSSNDNANLGNGGAGGNLGKQGCTNPDCSACSDCYSACVCQTGAWQDCLGACGLGSGGSGAQGGSGGSGATSGTGATSGFGGTAGSAGGTSAGALAAGLRVTEVAIYQGVKIPLMKGGGDVTQKNAPVVAGRPGVLRVFVSPDPGFQPREIVAKLELAGAAPVELKRSVAGATVENDLTTSFNFDLPTVNPDFAYAVSLHEAGSGGPAGATDGARYPANGESFVGAQSGGALNIRLVPMIIGGYTPDTSAPKVDAYRDRMMRLYPAVQVNIDVRAPVTHSGGVSANGSGWNSALDKLLQVRSADKPPKNTYYYGVLTPASSFFTFCGGGCVAGLSTQASPNDVWARGSIGLGFFPSGSSPGTTDTMAHEVGHAMGLPHAPCGVNNAGSFPYAGGIIGSWGYDIVGKNLIDPGKFKDMMGYCDPTWLSDFNYNRLFTRLSYVNSTADWIAMDPERSPGTFKAALIDADGALHWGATHHLDTSPMGEKRTVQVLDASGKVVGSVTGFEYPLEHDGGTILLVRKTALEGPNVHAIKPAGAALQLAL